MTRYIPISASYTNLPDSYLTMLDISLTINNIPVERFALMITNTGTKSAVIKVSLSYDTLVYQKLLTEQTINAGESLEIKLLEEPYLKIKIEAKNNIAGQPTDLSFNGVIIL
jgi:hypothetical protein